MSQQTEPSTAGLGFGDAVRMVFVTSARRWKPCVVIASVYALLTGVTDAVVRSSTGILDPTTLTPAEVLAASLAALAAIGIFVLVNIFVAPVTLGGLALVGSAEVYGDVLDTTGIVRRAFDRSLEAIGAALITILLLIVAPMAIGIFGLFLVVAGMAEAGFAVLIFGLIVVALPVLYVGVRLSLAIPVVMREGRGPVQALRRSWELVGGAWWWVFGVAVVVWMAIGVLNAVLSVRSFIGADATLDFLIGAVVTTAFTAVSTVLYGVALGVVYACRAPEDAAEAGALDPAPADDPQGEPPHGEVPSEMLPSPEEGPPTTTQ